MADVTVAQFADVLKVPVDRLLVQLEQAGITVKDEHAVISVDAKLELLTHLRRSHGSGEEGSSPRKITLKRKTQSELKLASAQGRARTVNVEVRVKRTYVKRDVLEEQNRAQQEAADQKRKEAEAAQQAETDRAEAERRERERLEQESRRRLEEEQDRTRQAAEDQRRAAVEQRETAQRDRDSAQRDRDTAQRDRETALRERETAERERNRRNVENVQRENAMRQERARAEAAAQQQAAVAAAAPPPPPPPPPPAQDRQPTRYGRKELHVSGDVSSRYKKKKTRMRGRPSMGDGEAKHGFEMPTAPMKR